MFNLAEFKMLVRIPPIELDKRLTDSIVDHINGKLANKVVPNVGLCICLFNIVQMEESFLIPGDGAVHTKVTFRYVVFRPIVEEILIGKIKSCSPEGVHVTLGFFDEILIPQSHLQEPSRFDETEQAWVWQYDSGEGTHDLFMDCGEDIRFRVVSDAFTETVPSTCPDSDPQSGESSSMAVKAEEQAQSRAPYTITASVAEPGLGVLSWWANVG